MRLGFDSQARLLETVVLIFRSGEEMVIHAMSARPTLAPTDADPRVTLSSLCLVLRPPFELLPPCCGELNHTFARADSWCGLMLAAGHDGRNEASSITSTATAAKTMVGRALAGST